MTDKAGSTQPRMALVPRGADEESMIEAGLLASNDDPTFTQRDTVIDVYEEMIAASPAGGKVTLEMFETIQSIVNYHTDIHDDNVLIETARDIIKYLGLENEE